MKIIKKTTLVLILLPLFVVGVFGQWMSSKIKFLAEKFIQNSKAQSQCWQSASTTGTTATTGTTGDGTTCTTGTTNTTCCSIGGGGGNGGGK